MCASGRQSSTGWSDEVQPDPTLDLELNGLDGCFPSELVSGGLLAFLFDFLLDMKDALLIIGTSALQASPRFTVEVLR